MDIKLEMQSALERRRRLEDYPGTLWGCVACMFYAGSARVRLLGWVVPRVLPRSSLCTTVANLLLSTSLNAFES